MTHPALTKAIELVGVDTIAEHVGVSRQAIQKWVSAGRLPRTEWTGETSYAEAIEKLTSRKVRKSALLERHQPTPKETV